MFGLGRLHYGAVWLLIERFLKDAGKRSENLIEMGRRWNF
jgi:hypothetical protein